ncbi:MAG: hypothetical protein ACXWT1_04485 [Methylobacter sp.]
MNTHPIQWQTPEPLWARFEATSEATDTISDQFRPAILRFATDDFMEQMLATLASDPAHIGNLLARPETWRSQPVLPEKDMVERVAKPSIVQALTRKINLSRPKSAIKPIASTRSVEEKKQLRNLPLKLYQPAHQRYYLISASLVCRVTGLPDRKLIQGGTEQIGFVLRRMMSSNSLSNDEVNKKEFAYTKDAQGFSWQQVATNSENNGRLVPGEELLPLFPMNYQDARNHKRTLWTGLVPVGRREEYMGASVNRNTIASTLTEAQLQSLQPSVATRVEASGVTVRMIQFKMEVAEPWKNLIRASYAAHDSLTQASPTGISGSESNNDKQNRVYALNLQWQMQSWLILLDFADFLAVHLPEVWNAVANNISFNEPLSSPRRILFEWLANATMPPLLVNALNRPISKPNTPAGFIQKQPKGSLGEALAAIGVARAGLEGTLKIYADTTANDVDWPDFHFLLAGLDTSFNPVGPYQSLLSLAPDVIIEEESDPSVNANPIFKTGSIEAEKLDRLTALVVRAMERKPETDAPEPPFALKLSKALKDTQGDSGEFVVRFVYMNKDCGPLHLPILSEPTQYFQLASFFDYDAPARPIRITLPMDTTPAGMRKHSKNTAFIISDVLCGQIQRAKGLGLGDLVRSVLPWPLHKDLDLGDGGACSNNSGNIGMICSLSIPIITICALILLMIIVSLLDLIFRWLPYFIICFPVPGLKGKQGDST